MRGIKKIYVHTIAAIMRVSRVRIEKRCEIAVENCNLGSKRMPNTLCSQPFSNNGTKIYGVHTPHSTMRALNAAFFIHAKIEENLCVFFGRSLFCFALFHFTLLTQNFSVLGFLFFHSSMFCLLVISGVSGGGKEALSTVKNNYQRRRHQD